MRIDKKTERLRRFTSPEEAAALLSHRQTLPPEKAVQASEGGRNNRRGTNHRN